jgi:hypothetical protein
MLVLMCHDVAHGSTQLSDGREGCPFVEDATKDQRRRTPLCCGGEGDANKHYVDTDVVAVFFFADRFPAANAAVATVCGPPDGDGRSAPHIPVPAVVHIFFVISCHRGDHIVPRRR